MADEPTGGFKLLAGDGGTLDTGLTALAAFADELETVVVRLEVQWNSQHSLAPETAEDVHRLRVRADGIFEKIEGA